MLVEALPAAVRTSIIEGKGELQGAISQSATLYNRYMLEDIRPLPGGIGPEQLSSQARELAWQAREGAARLYVSLPFMRAAVTLRKRLAPRTLLEASGGVTLENVRAIARTGVDRIAVGRLTHSAPSLDCSLRVTHGSL